MPRVFRTMFEDDGKPRVGIRWCCLGVRPPGGPGLQDVDIDKDGCVELNGKGMSVFRSLGDLVSLPARLVPETLQSVVPGAIGPLDARIWTLGEGDFSDGLISPGLRLHADPTRNHGVIAPAVRMTLDEFQTVLETTRDEWTVEEPEVE